jgi:hypothetical protein
MGRSWIQLWPFPLFDGFPDGRWVVASSRAEQEPLGRILTSEGREISRLRLGDGIQHLKVDEGARIWVGWFDEGVSGMTAGGCRGMNGRQAATGWLRSMMREPSSLMRAAAQLTA